MQAKYHNLFNIILTNFKALQIQKQSPIGVFQKKVFCKYTDNIQENTHAEA